MSDPIELHPALVLGAFCEGLVGGGRRVALLGDGTTGLGARLAEACGRRVHVYDPDAQRVAAWFAKGQPDSAAMSYALFEADLDVRAGAFDVVVVPDLTAFPSPEAALGAARAFAGGRGVAVVASPNPEHGVPSRAAALAGAAPARALAYLALYDLCHAAFPAVKVLGQAPFAGHAFADFAAKDPAVTIDTSLCTATEEPAWFVLVLGERPPAVDPYTLVQVPVAALAAPPPTDPAELAAARLRTTVLEGELDKLREREREAARLAEERLATATAEGTRAAELAARTAELATRAAAAEGRHAELARRFAALETAHAALTQKAAVALPASERFEAAVSTARVLEAQLVERDAALEDLRAKLERERTSAAGRGDDLVKVRARVTELEETLGTERKRAATLEGGLAAERQRAQVLEQALRGERQRLAELEARAERAAAAPPPPPPPVAAPAPEPGEDPRDKHIQRLLESAAQAQRERDEARARIRRLEDEVAEAERLAEAADTRATELVARLSDPSIADVHTAEVDAMEQLLRERGVLVDGLRRDLAAAERFGRELIGELEAAHALGRGLGAPSVPSTVGLDPLVFGGRLEGGAPEWPEAAPAQPTLPAPAEPAPPPPPPRASGELGAVVADRAALAQKCARLEADLEAARWRLAALEAERSEASDTDGVPVVQKLEAALLAAREELASLRHGA